LHANIIQNDAFYIIELQMINVCKFSYDMPLTHSPHYSLSSITVSKYLINQVVKKLTV